MSTRRPIDTPQGDALPRASRRAILKTCAALGLCAPLTAGPLRSVAAQDVTPVAGGRITALTVADPDNLDNHVSLLAQVSQITGSICDTLLRLDSTDLQIKPRLATEWVFSTPTTLDVTLRAGVLFHDGQALTAEDIKFNLDRVQDPATASPRAAELEPIDLITVVDDTHLTLTLSRPWPSILESIAVVPIYPRTATAESLQIKPIGTGPFRFLEWKPNDYLRLERNPDYWQEGFPYLDEIDFRPVGEAETRFAMMETQAADVMFTLPLKNVARAEGNDELAVHFGAFPNTGDILYVNNSRAPMDNADLRLAVSYAVDRETFFATFLTGYGGKNTSPWVKDHWAYSAINDTAFTYDLEMAATYLEKAGYPGGKAADGTQLEINLIYPAGYPEWQQGSVMIQAAMKEIGVSVKVEEVELATWIDRIVKTDEYDLSWDFIVSRAVDPATTLNYAFFYKQGDQNIPRYTDQMLADLAEEGAGIIDQAARKPIYDAWQARWNEVQLSIILGDRKEAILAQAKLAGYFPNIGFGNDFTTAWIDES